MAKKYDVIAIGRACIDLNAVEYNRPMEETMTFSKYVGGSPANIVIGAAKLGLSVGFIGKIPDDQHGNFIKRYMADAGVDTDGMVIDQEGHKSGLTFTEIKSPEECSILMYRDEVADLYLRPEEVSAEYIKQATNLVVSGTALSKSPSREAVLKAIAIAKANEVRVIFELDYRPYTWTNAEEVSIYYSLAARQADIIIGTRDEFDMLENRQGGDNNATVAELFKYSPQLIVIKHGVEGSYAYERDGKVTRGYAYKSNVLKTFGAGDSYAAAFITALHAGKGVEDALKYGSAAAAIVVSKHSSSEAMPTIEAIEQIMSEQAATYGS
ncbi:5-dehydro-2-deoxygluconokinase [Paenibacillus azoreducens]|uniref:5-dehydro-2-deoxygluconokinase n=1 Tax=Paenibacillus azoreducens TaxID=116718 RepID=A0A919Y625_9BACL|nr:5-dehydro-2-deoxygluconokinase [Paenibacillus azoreducens]GIO45606.1 5-dehydro-2-deoxygluconokinase [Paenibacillus azoreducens]